MDGRTDGWAATAKKRKTAAVAEQGEKQRERKREMG